MGEFELEIEDGVKVYGMIVKNALWLSQVRLSEPDPPQTGVIIISIERWPELKLLIDKTMFALAVQREKEIYKNGWLCSVHDGSNA